MKKILWELLGIVFLTYAGFAIDTKVILLKGSDDVIRVKIEKVLTDILNAVNQSYEMHEPLDGVKSYFLPDAFEDFKLLVRRTNPHALQKEYRTYLLETANGHFEVRNLKVHIFLGGTEGVPFQNFVFVLDKQGRVVSSHFSVEEHHYQQIIAEGKKLEDLAYREKILHFIEIYRTAYNKKDLEFIEKTLSEDALIIVGYVIKTKKQDVNYLEKSYLGDEKIQFIRLGKYEYLQRLKKVFSSNDFVNVEFEEINIQRHPQFDKIYGVQLKQKWQSSFYSDQGYLFLMVDFMEEEQPIIHVRAWQPEKFADGSTINIYDFEVIE